MYCEPLPLNSNSAWYGNKIANLNKILASGTSPARVAGGFVINNLGFMAFLDKHISFIDRAFKECDFKSIRSIGKTSAEIREHLGGQEFSGGLSGELVKHFDTCEKPVIVRSSSSFEDSDTCSYAGVFDSCPAMLTERQFLQAVKCVYLSCFSPRALAYCGSYTIPKMSVLVQEMVYPEFSGLCFTQHPDKPDSGYLSTVIGPLDPLVEGRTNPHASWRIEGGKWCLDSGDSNTEFLLAKVWSAACRIKTLFGHDIDMEWGLADDDLYVFQARPITQKPVEYCSSLLNWNKAQYRKILEGVAVPPRRIPAAVRGRVSIQREPGGDFPAGSILVTEDTSPDWELLMHKARGIITNHGCRTSHAALVARELGIPALVGTMEATRKLRDGQEIAFYFDNPLYGAAYVKNEED